jgi:TonB-linked SusC/RagA family outer membrane protein
MYKKYTNFFGTPQCALLSMLFIMVYPFKWISEEDKRKWIMRIKLTTFLLIASLMQISAATFGQRVTLKGNNITLDQVFRQIHKQTGYDILISIPKVQNAKRINVNFNDTPLDKVMSSILEGTDFSYSIEEKTVVVAKRETQDPVIENNNQRNIDVRGKVTDSSGDALPGASIKIKGNNRTLTADQNGEFSIQGLNQGTVLVISFVGYLAQEITVGNQPVINVILLADNRLSDLNEVMVVGYGTQKKETLTGSIASVKGAELVKTPQPNLSSSFAGRVPGIIASNGSGEPGYDGSSILIRGMSTTGNNSPLIVVDGVANRLGGLERINPDDIESVSVLKDASAAIYGAQAANGVILITTKKGKKNKPELTYSYNQGFVTPSSLPKMADAATFATILNETDYYRNPSGGLNQSYTPQEIEKFRNGSDPLNYSNTNWLESVLKPYSVQNKHNLSVRGGTESVDYYVSAGKIFQDGLYENGTTEYNQYNVLANVSVKLSERLKVGAELSGRKEKRTTPQGIGAGSIFQSLYLTYPFIPVYYPNGLISSGNGAGRNPAIMVNGDEVGIYDSETNIFNGTLNGSYELPIKGLSLDGFFAVDQQYNYGKGFSKPYITYQYDKNSKTYNVIKGGPNAANLSEATENISLITSNIKLNYKLLLGAHDISAFVAYEQSETKDASFSASRLNFLSTDLPELSQGGSLPTDYGNSGSSFRTARQNFFGRVNYSFKGKYLAEFQLRYDGSSIFPEGNRFGFFPGISAGWRLSEEPFIKKLGFVDNLKLRASYGQLGNDKVTTYQYLDQFGLQSGLFATGDPAGNVTGIGFNKLANPNITWEVAKKYNIGLDGTLFKNFSFVLNFFKEDRSNILAKRSSSIPVLSGISSDQIPDENIGSVENKGVEIELNYSGKINDFGINIGGNFTFAKNKIIYLDEAPNTISYQKYTGMPIGSDLFYQASGIFRSQSEIDNYPHLPGTVPGDLKYLDYNGDGIINASDRVRSDLTAVPQIVYGITAGVTWKDLDLTVLFSGQARSQQYLLPDAGTIGNFPSSWADNRWSPTNPDGTYPRVTDRSSTTYESYRNTFWLRNTAFLRLKNIQLGYSLPKNFVSKINLAGVRVYTSGFNLLTFTSLKDYDPEGADANGYFYPQQKIYNIGINVTF